MKNEGEGCGFPPHGIAFYNHTYSESFGLCKEGLYCQWKFSDDRSPGICLKAEKGNHIS